MATKIEKLVVKAFRLKQQIKDAEAEYEGVRQQIQQFFDEKLASDENEIIVGDIVARKVEKVNVTYFPDKLHEKLPRKLFKKVTSRKYIVKPENLQDLIELLKRAGVKANEFKQYINPEVTVDREALKNLYELGEISKKDLDGCYNAKLIKYIDVKEKAGGSD